MSEQDDFTGRSDATLMIDGAAVRRLREQRNLTQLYVAKVVGVTTDTISRWENNRYPSIRRQNAERLAEALEVAVEQILQDGPVAPDADGAASAGRLPFWRRRPLLLGLLLTAGLVGLLWAFWPGTAATLRAQRLLPSYAAPATRIPVQLVIEGSSARAVVRETLPPGWQLIAADPAPDSVDAASGLLRWMIRLENAPVVLHYLVQVAAGPAHSPQPFVGELVMQGASKARRQLVLGADQLVVSPLHWADLNGDGHINDDEMLAASEIIEQAPALPLDFAAIEALWSAGAYHWDAQQAAFAPGPPPQQAVEKLPAEPMDGRR
ncbi:helix-turn-helix transcriptional regulator [Desulfuromonas thiophila]|uniref:Helix-turn-helix n=1 Tax=Desulfuromonas thiophila TaxID=57664 RepID=A0A1G7DRG2_9BACT|nr:helix-turn-helix transcriptional regulator [Desulfuromonas thiophila]SDE54032.1 Helix-turn-helix [Desulfuromonas thiophila]